MSLPKSGIIGTGKRPSGKKPADEGMGNKSVLCRSDGIEDVTAGLRGQNWPG